MDQATSCCAVSPTICELVPRGEGAAAGVRAIMHFLTEPWSGIHDTQLVYFQRVCAGLTFVASGFIF